MARETRGFTRRAFVLGASAGVGALVTRQCLLPTNDPGPPFPAPAVAGNATVLDDASQLSPTPVVSHVTITAVSYTHLTLPTKRIV